MYYFILLCVAVLLHTSVALNGCNDTCSSLLAVNGSGNFNDDCNAGVTAEFFKCISALSNCDDVSKARIAEQSITKHYQGLAGHERWGCGLGCGCTWLGCGCGIGCSKRDANGTIPLVTCSKAGLCECNNKCKMVANYTINARFTLLSSFFYFN